VFPQYAPCGSPRIPFATWHEAGECAQESRLFRNELHRRRAARLNNVGVTAAAGTPNAKFPLQLLAAHTLDDKVGLLHFAFGEADT
jgi:hypothetical protein